jgi:hypothetical protein
MTKYYIKQHLQQCWAREDRLVLMALLGYLFYSTTIEARLCASTIEIPDGWTPKLFMGLLLQERFLTKNVLSIF